MDLDLAILVVVSVEVGLAEADLVEADLMIQTLKLADLVLAVDLAANLEEEPMLVADLVQVAAVSDPVVADLVQVVAVLDQAVSDLVVEAVVVVAVAESAEKMAISLANVRMVAVVAAEHAINVVKKVISHVIVLKLVVVEEVVSYFLFLRQF